MKKILSCLIFLTTFLTSFAQINFSSLPLEKQLVGRNLETNMGTIVVEGDVNIGDNYYLDFSNWNAGEPNNNPSPENAAEIVNNSGKWNDRNENDIQDSYVEYEGLITSLGDLVYLGNIVVIHILKTHRTLTGKMQNKLLKIWEATLLQFIQVKKILLLHLLAFLEDGLDCTKTLLTLIIPSLQVDGNGSVSYTHLTLPTIYSV